jgi:hypothetical protein
MDGFRNWIKACLAEHRPPLRESDYSIVSGVLRGLRIDVLATGDSRRTGGLPGVPGRVQVRRGLTRTLKWGGR